jgi:hypothetical protein
MKYSFFMFMALFAGVSLLSFAVANEAKILFYKSIDKTEPVIENKEFVISYKIINVGDGPAYNIELSDKYSEASFDCTSHERQVMEGREVEGKSWIIIDVPTIPPEEDFEFNVTVIPKLFGSYGSTLARIQYQGGADRILDDDDDDDDEYDDEDNLDLENEDEDENENEDENEDENTSKMGRIGFSNSLGKIKIIEQAVHDRQQSYHLDAWAIFTTCLLLCIGIPYLYM